MIVKNVDVVNIMTRYSSIKNKKIPVKVAFALSRNISILNPIADDYEKERYKLLEKYGEKDEDGKPKIVNGQYILNDREGFNADMNELLNMENEVNFYKISVEDLEKCDEDRFDTLTPDELEGLYTMIE